MFFWRQFFNNNHFQRLVNMFKLNFTFIFKYNSMGEVELWAFAHFMLGYLMVSITFNYVFFVNVNIWNIKVLKSSNIFFYKTDLYFSVFHIKLTLLNFKHSKIRDLNKVSIFDLMVMILILFQNFKKEHFNIFNFPSLTKCFHNVLIVHLSTPA